MFRNSVRFMRAAVPRTILRSQALSVQSQGGIPFRRSLYQARPIIPTSDRRSTPQLVRELRTAPVLRNEEYVVTAAQCSGLTLPSTGWLHNILEDSSIPIRVANVTKNELTLTDGLVVPSSCIFLNGNVFVWNPPVLDPMNVMPNGKGWEEWTDDVWTILEVVHPRPGSCHSALHTRSLTD